MEMSLLVLATVLLTIKHHVKSSPSYQPRMMTREGGGYQFMGHIGMCRCEGYGFQAVYSSIGYINQSF